jgi:hypothetical protein
MTFSTTDDATVERTARVLVDAAERAGQVMGWDYACDLARDALAAARAGETEPLCDHYARPGTCPSSACPHAARGDATPTVTEWAVDESWDGCGIVEYGDEDEARRAYRVQYDNPTRRLLAREATEWREVQP